MKTYRLYVEQGYRGFYYYKIKVKYDLFPIWITIRDTGRNSTWKYFSTPEEAKEAGKIQLDNMLHPIEEVTESFE
jgi:hypothetical protein